jgi:soluble lytic murein transglycosylase-like protein
MTGTRNISFLCKSQATGWQFITGREYLFVCIRDRLQQAWPIAGVSIVLAVLFVCIADTGSLRAEMFVCHNRSGKMHFTNVRNDPDCETFDLTKDNGSWANFSNESWAHISHGADRSRYDREIRRIGSLYNVDPCLIKAIIHTESDFDHRAVSRCGAQGLMQLMPGTAKDLQVANPFNPKENIEGGTRYFRSLLDNFHEDLVLSLAAYNAGPGLVTRTGGVPKIPETQNYIKKVLRRYKVYKTTW